MTGTDLTYEHLAGLRGMLTDLNDALVPGTPRRWAQQDLTPAQRARQDALAAVERETKAENIARGIKALGDGRAPLDLSVLDATADIAVGVSELEDAITEQLGITSLLGEATAGRITRIIGLLDRIALYPDLADHVHTEAVRLHRAASRALGDSEPVRRLNARCHVCDARSLRAFMDRELIVCVSESCRCDDKQCGCHNDPPRRHKWPFTTWPWLAELLAEDIGVA